MASKLVQLDFRRDACPGCRHDYYNHKQSGDGWNAATSGSGCWHLRDLAYNRSTKQYDCVAGRRSWGPSS